MPRHDPRLTFPARGTPGGSRDPWDPPDDAAQLRAQAVATERQLEQRAAQLGRRWQRQIQRERARQERKR